MDEDKLLMIKFQNGDKDAFEELISKYRHKAISFAIRFGCDHYIAEDIVQECFAYLYVNRNNYNIKFSFKTYLYAMIKNKSIDYMRKWNRVCPSSEVDMMGISLNTPEEIYLQKEESEELNSQVKKLKDDYKTVVYLIDYEGFTYKEAASIMKKTVPQIKILVFRARKKIKTLYCNGGLNSDFTKSKG
ncbi:RNA polymerase sigma factor [Clostridium grantii]|uniref:RNA polymerase sigma-70 factor, ECF subfamily n=1 Tax=Clostridium grantii DSM 8605 TaxID=1121316 RepID=A0A1M5WTE3_9CLOT|nr:RNA polymerase sigma factor [Clostridium grantii]SHH90817.1 RNA polymerase sigma-70 factor, ECF subfamily [Clostridium grantii DSM 8605]